MKLNALLKLLEKHNIPDDVTLMSDSGWECCATEMDGVYYNSLENVIVFTQDMSNCDEYYGKLHWERLE